MIYDKDIYYCGKCKKSVTDECIECSMCLKWYHRVCTKLSKKALKEKSSDDIYWYCRNCENVLPFGNVEDAEIRQDYLNVDVNLNNYDLYEKCTNLF